MQFGQTFLDVIYLQLILTLDSVDLFPKHSDLTVLFFLLFLMLERFFPKSTEQLGNFIIFNRYHFLEAVKLNAEKLILVIYAFFQIFKLKIEYLLELIPKFIELLTFLLICLVTGDALLLDELLQTTNLLVFLVANLLHSALNHTLNILLL